MCTEGKLHGRYGIASCRPSKGWSNDKRARKKAPSLVIYLSSSESDDLEGEYLNDATCVKKVAV